MFSYHFLYIFHEKVLQILFLQQLKKTIFLIFEALDFVLPILVINITSSAFPYLIVVEELRDYLQSFDDKFANNLNKV